MMTVDLRPGERLELGRPRELFAFSEDTLLVGCGNCRCYSVAPDGRRFYGVERQAAPTPPPVTQIHLIQGWTAELEGRVPAGPRNGRPASALATGASRAYL